MIIAHFSTALRQLATNKGKAALTMLGIIIGIGSVIFIMTLGEIAKNFLLSQISQFGTNVVEISTTSQFGIGGDETIELTDDDIEALEQSPLLPEITQLAGAYTVGKTVVSDGDNYTATLFGMNTAGFAINHFKLLAGHFFTETDERISSRVVVVGSKFANDVFGSEAAAINEVISVDGSSFTIVGVMEEPPSFGAFGGTTLYTPISSVRRLFAPADEQTIVQFIILEFTAGSDSASLTKRIEYELNRLKHTEDKTDVFFIASRKQFLEIFDSILLGIQLFVSAIAGISLVVGGIGIMNIMLVTVQERTKEIGLRKAVGAKNRSILTQFLIEAVVLTTVGGIIGITLGLGLCLGAVVLANTVQPDWSITFVFVPQAIILACGVSVATGIAFGLYPAFKASRLHPIESLRYE